MDISFTATPSGFYNPNQNYGLGFNAQTDLGFGNGFLDSALRIVLFLAGISILAQVYKVAFSKNIQIYQQKIYEMTFF